MYNLGEQFNLPALKAKGMYLILENFEEIAKNGDHLRFNEKFLAEILEKYFNVKDFKVCKY